MRESTVSRAPSIANDLGSLAGLYKTVLWMIGRKAQYGRIWPPEADMDGEEALEGSPTASVHQMETAHAAPIEVGARD